MKMKTFAFVSLFVFAGMFCYGQHNDTEFTLSTWVTANGIFDQETWDKKIAYYTSLGITEILVKAKPESYPKIIETAKKANIKVHAWMWTLNRPNDPIANRHPDWYAVNRKGENSLHHPAYVNYYQWLSPFHPEARAHIKHNVKELLAIEGLASVHLDYVRYVDVILGADLQPRYKIKQDRELPEYDYDYHPLARKAFEDIFGYDIMELEHPELSTEWKQVRLNAVTSLVNEIIETAHLENKKITAAVFPFPEMARRMVGQAWNDWHLDAAYPMLYHNFYRESINWIGFATKQGVSDTDFPIYAGLYMSALQKPDEIREAFRQALENGASGISMFTADGLTEEQQVTMREIMGD